MSENNFGTVILPGIKSPQYYFIQPQTVLLKGTMASKQNKQTNKHPKVDESIGNKPGNFFGVPHSSQGAGGKADCIT